MDQRTVISNSQIDALEMIASVIEHLDFAPDAYPSQDVVFTGDGADGPVLGSVTRDGLVLWYTGQVG